MYLTYVLKTIIIGSLDVGNVFNYSKMKNFFVKKWVVTIKEYTSKNKDIKIEYKSQQDKREDVFNCWSVVDTFQASCSPRTREEHEPFIVNNELMDTNLCNHLVD